MFSARAILRDGSSSLWIPYLLHMNMENAKHNPDRWALITGASRGLGRALALQAAARGWSLILVARRDGPLQEMAQCLKDDHDIRVLVLSLDLATANGVELLLAELRQRHIAPTLLVNNAASGLCGPFLDSGERQNLEQNQLNMLSLSQLCRGLLPAMLKQGEGYILNVASTAAFAPGPGMALYYASKAFVRSFSHALRVELRHTPVRITCLCPGPMNTDFQHNADMRTIGGLKTWLELPTAKVAARGFRAVLKGRAEVVPGLLNRILVHLASRLPMAFVAQFSQQTPRENP